MLCMTGCMKDCILWSTILYVFCKPFSNRLHVHYKNVQRLKKPAERLANVTLHPESIITVRGWESGWKVGGKWVGVTTSFIYNMQSMHIKTISIYCSATSWQILLNPCKCSQMQ